MTDSGNKNPKTGPVQYLKANIDSVRDLCDSVALIILSLYPFRVIHKGLDLWDTGYNYANFEYMGKHSVDPMWLFSTYLSNGIGHLMTMLPYGHTLRGMNFYTSFVPAFIAVIMYLVFTRVMKFPAPLAFVGEFAALSMCWAPTGVLYHYLTYLIITLSAACLYHGLTRDRRMYLIISGALCGLGIYVRFSNLPQFSLIIAIWMYGMFEFREAFASGESGRLPSRVETVVKSFVRGLWFILGYFGAAFLFLVYLGIRYGFVEYVKGVGELFSIPDNAEGYSTTAMILAVLKSYYDQLYWVVRLLIFALVGGILYFGACFVYDKAIDRGSSGKNDIKRAKFIKIAVIITGGLISAISVLFLISREYVTFKYDSYWCVFALAGLMSFVTLCFGLFGTFRRNDGASSRLLAVLAVYTLLISAIGGNNGSYSSYNNMFFWFPCMLFALYKLWKNTKYPWIYGLKCVITGTMLFFLFQSTLFGFNFAFAEADFGSDEPRDYIVTDNQALKGIRMSYDKAYSFERISGFIEEKGLLGREVITYGYIPGTAFYLQMRPAFNSWPDLDSYDKGKLQSKLDDILEDIRNGGEDYEKPVVILNISPSAGRSDNERKWQMIYDFIDEGDYKLVYVDSMLALYE